MNVGENQIKHLKQNIVHVFSDEDGIFGVMVLLDEEVSKILKQLGLTNSEIGHAMRIDKENHKIVVNLMDFGWWNQEIEQALGVTEA